MTGGVWETREGEPPTGPSAKVWRLQVKRPIRIGTDQGGRGR